MIDLSLLNEEEIQDLKNLFMEGITTASLKVSLGICNGYDFDKMFEEAIEATNKKAKERRITK